MINAVISNLLYALGDLHGDFNNTIQILQYVNLINRDLDWVGSNNILVQTGDIVDRGHDTIVLYSFFEKLKKQAETFGGKVINLLGNHEIMNLQKDYRYVSKKDIKSFGGRKNRIKEFGKHGTIGSFIRSFKTIEIIKDTLFVHAGLTSNWAVNGKEGLNSMIQKTLDVDENLSGEVFGENGPFWYRGYALEKEEKICPYLYDVLKTTKTKRMVVGHTIQQDLKINTRCESRLYLIDTAISHAYGGRKSILKFDDKEIKPIYPDAYSLMEDDVNEEL